MKNKNFAFSNVAVAVITALTSLTATANSEGTNVKLAEVEVLGSSENSVLSTEVKPHQHKAQQTLRQFFKDEPNINIMGRTNDRIGTDNVQVRGLSGNRVKLSVDGIDLPESDEQTRFRSLGRVFSSSQYIETAGLASAQVHKGAKSNKGLGASINFSTVSIPQVLQNKTTGGFVQTRYDSLDHAWNNSLALATQQGIWSGMALASYNLGKETQNYDKEKIAPLKSHNRYLLTKQQIELNAQHSLNLTTEFLRKHYLRTVTSPRLIEQNDRVYRDRLSIRHDYKNESGWLQKAKTHLYWQNARTHNYVSTLNNGFSREKNVGFESQLTSVLNPNHTLEYGLSLSHHAISNSMIAWTAPRPAIPARAGRPAIPAQAAQPIPTAHPDSDLLNVRLNLEDYVQYGAMSIIPHLDYLHYKYSPKKGNYQQAAASVIPVKEKSVNAFLPKLELEWQITPLIRPFIQYGYSIKTPSPQHLSVSYSSGMGYGAVGNANLEPEKANNLEFGFRGQNDALSYQLTGFYNKYRDFIETVTLDNPPPQFTNLFSFDNMSKARIYGVEWAAQYAFNDNLSTGLKLGGTKGYTLDNTGNKRAIKSIAPVKAKWTLAYQTERWGANIEVVHSRAKKDKDIPSKVSYNPVKQYTIANLGVYWQAVKNLTISANVNNLFNKKHWDWLATGPNVGERTARNTNMLSNAQEAAQFAEPGRNYNVGVRYEF